MSGNSVERRFVKNYERRGVSGMTPFRQVSGVHIFLPPLMLVTHFATETSPCLVWRTCTQARSAQWPKICKHFISIRNETSVWGQDAESGLSSHVNAVSSEVTASWSNFFSLSLRTVVSKKDKIGKFLQIFKSNTQMQSGVKFQCHMCSATCTLVNVPWEPLFEITVS